MAVLDAGAKTDTRLHAPAEGAVHTKEGKLCAAVKRQNEVV